MTTVDINSQYSQFCWWRSIQWLLASWVHSVFVIVSCLIPPGSIVRALLVVYATLFCLHMFWSCVTDAFMEARVWVALHLPIHHRWSALGLNLSANHILSIFLFPAVLLSYVIDAFLDARIWEMLNLMSPRLCDVLASSVSGGRAFVQ